MTPGDIQRKELAGLLAKELEDIRGCGCCGEYMSTQEQYALSEQWSVPAWTVVAADILIKNGVKL